MTVTENGRGGPMSHLYEMPHIEPFNLLLSPKMQKWERDAALAGIEMAHAFTCSIGYLTLNHDGVDFMSAFSWRELVTNELYVALIEEAGQ